MQNEPRWLEADEIIETNQAEVAATQEPFFLRDRGLLESACGRPRNLWAYSREEDIVRLAVVLASGIARNHAFEQGNKRTALTAALLFIELNGYRWTGSDTEEWGFLIEALILNRINEVELAELLRPHVQPV